MTERATKRPEGFAKPAHWTNDPLPPAMPEAKDEAVEDLGPKDGDSPEGLSPTRYGDWVRNGIAVDF